MSLIDLAAQNPWAAAVVLLGFFTLIGFCWWSFCRYSDE